MTAANDSPATPDAFTIVRATRDDAPDIAPLFDGYRRFYRQASDLDGARAFLSERLTHDESVVYFARPTELARPTGLAKPSGNGGQALGFVQLYPTFSSVSMGTRWILNDLFVDEAARGKGVARALMLRAMRHARETGAHGMMLLTELTNTPAQKLYESLAWSRDEVYHRYTWKP